MRCLDIGMVAALVGLTPMGCGGDGGLKAMDAGTLATGGSRDTADDGGATDMAALGGTVGFGGATSTGSLGGTIAYGDAVGTSGLGGATGYGGAVGTSGRGGILGLGGASGDGGGGTGGLVDAAAGAGGQGLTNGTGGAGGQHLPSGTGGAVLPPPIDANCGMTSIAAMRAPTDMLLLLDRSASMDNSIAEDCACSTASGTSTCADLAGCTSRWSSLASALAATLSTTPGIAWGLKLFATPGGSSCNVSSGVEIPIGSDSASVIASQMASVAPGNNTPTAAAITAATEYLETVGDGNSKAILLATDGQPNCKAGGSSSTSDVDGALAAITAARAAGFLVYVIGIGPSVGNLDYFAKAGGTDTYFPASSPSTLAAALAAVGKAAATCTFWLSSAPPDPSNIAVYLDKKLVPADPGNGWRFGASSQTLMLDGSACARLEDGSATMVEVLFGCPGIPFPSLLP